MKVLSRRQALLCTLALLLTAMPKETTAATELALVNRSFSFELFKITAAAHQKENVLISPFSLFLALSMVCNGASGDNRDQMAKVLGVSANMLGQLNARNKSLLSLLNEDKFLTLSIANAVFADKAAPFKTEFIKLSETDYSADAVNLNFKEEQETLEAINGWCFEKTHGKIPKILSKIGKQEKMVLLNAIFFKGDWEEKFSVTTTSDQIFYPSPGQPVTVKMMHKTSSIKHFEGAGFASVSLPYRGGKQSMCIFLPDEDSDIEAFQAQLSDANWNKWMSSYATKQVALSVPKLKLNFEDSIGSTLEAMGMKAAFKAESGTFLNLIPAPYLTWISKVIHKTFMDVTEEGTEAAAATAVVMNYYKVRTSPPIMKPLQFAVERPCMLALVDNASGEILFLGKILKP